MRSNPFHYHIVPFVFTIIILILIRSLSPKLQNRRSISIVLFPAQSSSTIERKPFGELSSQNGALTKSVSHHHHSICAAPIEVAINFPASLLASELSSID